jgi:hypothetical protein
MDLSAPGCFFVHLVGGNVFLGVEHRVPAQRTSPNVNCVQQYDRGFLEPLPRLSKLYLLRR